MIKLADYLPNYYDGVIETDSLMTAEQTVFDDLDVRLGRILLNLFVTQADASGLTIFENQLGMEVEAGTTLEIRRQNILLRIMPPQPITIGYFRSLLKSVNIPADIVVDSINSLVTTLSKAEAITTEQVERLRFMLNTYLPSNLAYQISKQDGATGELPLNLGFASHNVVNVTIGAQSVNYEEV